MLTLTNFLFLSVTLTCDEQKDCITITGGIWCVVDCRMVSFL